MERKMSSRHRPERRARSRSGAALLEALVALTILATAGAAIVVFATDAFRAVVLARAADAEVRRANALLEAVTLWPREDLDRHLGDRAQGPFRMVIQRPVPTLYTVVLTDSTRRRQILRTAIYRSERQQEVRP